MKFPSAGFWRPYLAILLGFLILDGLWLGLIARSWYLSAMSPLMRENPVLWPWLAFYLLYGQAILWLIVRPSAQAPLQTSTLRGALLGATAYGTYNLTAYSLIAGWSLSITLIDWAWGTILTALLSTLGTVVIQLGSND